MTDDEVMRILAGRDDSLPYFPIDDRNALARVIGGMTEEEFGRFWNNIVIVTLQSGTIITARWLFTCSPRIIAEACAAAITAGKEGGGA